MSKKDYHAQGQHDREKSRNDGWLDLILNGGCGSHYDPPAKTEAREQYNKGWKNAERK